MKSRLIDEKKSYFIFIWIISLCRFGLWTFVIMIFQKVLQLGPLPFKLCQLIEDDECYYLWKFKKSYFIFFELSPFARYINKNLSCRLEIWSAERVSRFQQSTCKTMDGFTIKNLHCNFVGLTDICKFGYLEGQIAVGGIMFHKHHL